MILAAAAEQPTASNWRPTKAMPLRVTDQTQWCWTPHGLRWAQEHSGALNGSCRCRLWLANDGRPQGPPGPRAGWLAARPRLDLLCRPRHHFRTKEKDLEHPPQRHVRKKLKSLIRTNRLHLEWIALGCTVKLFLDRLAAFDCEAGKSREVQA